MKILPEFNISKNLIVVASEILGILKIKESSYQEIETYLKSINKNYEENLIMEGLDLLFLIGAVSIVENKIRVHQI
jgi:hypothetical protein